MAHLSRVALCLFILAPLGCDGGAGIGGGGKLTEAECRQLHAKIDEIMFADLSAADRAEAQGTEADQAEAIQECVADQPWDRKGFECAMKATTEAELDLCILKS